MHTCTEFSSGTSELRNRADFKNKFERESNERNTEETLWINKGSQRSSFGQLSREL